MNGNIEETEQKTRHFTSRKRANTWFLIGIIGIIVAIIVKFFIFDFLTVSGTSMNPTIKDGETIFVNKLSYGIALPFSDKLLIQWSTPQKNDVVIYLYNDKIVVKRCIATSDDLLEYSFDSGYTLYVGEKNIPLTELQYANLKNSTKVPEGYILAVGDNYAESFDSRNYGFVSVKNVLGKIICK